jgi:hypothetical protein
LGKNSQLLNALEKAAGFVRDMMAEGGEAFRQKHLQPVINKTVNIREEARREIYIAVK